MKEPVKQYLSRKEYYHKYLIRLEKHFRRMIQLKLLVLLGGLVLTIYFVINKGYVFGGGALFLGIALLILLDVKHNKIQQQQKYATILKDLNEHALWRLDQRWTTFPDTGEELKNENHPFSSDLDIFGKGSLFQWINTSHTFLGRKRLAALLTSPPEGIPQIIERQKAIAELAKDLKWRQWLSVYGIEIAGEIQDPEDLIRWAEKKKESFFSLQSVVFSIQILPIITFIMIILFLTHQLPFYLPLGTVLLQYILLKVNQKERNRILNHVFYYRSNLELYHRLLEHIERKHFRSDYLRNLKTGLLNQNGNTAAAQLSRLVKISDHINTRQHGFYGIFNLLTLWDYHCLIALDRWKAQAGRNLAKWLEIIGDIEALASLATLNYDHPDWATPQIIEHPLYYTAKDLGHPLLSDPTRKGNDLNIKNPIQSLLITGSNMSGKSTFLRATGINLVLAYAGASVCAKTLTCSRFNIYTCMRVSDNLEKSISTFYAELLRIKMIVADTADQKPTFFLLDEIFKGTNSIDRHNGAKVLIKKLIQNKAIGLVSTHDLELAELERECKQLKNFHFQEYFQDNKLCFDYLLRPGVSTTRNALYLMRAAGIDIENDQ